MSFTVSDLRDLIQLLREHPEWRDAVRQEILNDDFRAMPRALRELAEAQTRTERRVEELARTVAELVETQKVANERLDRLESLYGRLNGRLGNVEGALYEQRYRDNAPSRLGARLRRIERVHLGQVEALLEALDRGLISEQEWNEVAALDLLVRGRAGREPVAPQRYFAVEVSVTIDLNDVTRASERAAILARAGLSVEACVAGQGIRPEAEEEARARGVTVLLDRVAA